MQSEKAPSVTYLTFNLEPTAPNGCWKMSCARGRPK
jgi:hypothetical protein